MLHFAHAHANCTRLLDRRVEPGDEARHIVTELCRLIVQLYLLTIKIIECGIYHKHCVRFILAICKAALTKI